MLWLIGQTTTDREKLIFAKVRDRLRVAFEVKTDESGTPPPIGFYISMYTLNNQTALSLLHFAPRPPVSLYRSLVTGICTVSGSADSCADTIVNALYARASEWYNIPPYPASGR